MDHIDSHEVEDVARLVELTGDAVIVCDVDGTVRHINEHLLSLLTTTREHVVSMDIKDMLFSSKFERSSGNQVPFATDGEQQTLMLKLIDGSFIPVSARALELNEDAQSRKLYGHRYIIALQSLEEQLAANRKTQRLLTELQSSNKRLAGTLSIIMSTVGSDDLPKLMDTVLNNMVDTLEATGAALYFAEAGGFKLRGLSRSLQDSYVPRFMPYGAGIATYVVREQRACRFTVVPGAPDGVDAYSSFYDLDSHVRHNLRLQDTPPFKSLIALPVYFGRQVLGTLELGWSRPCIPRVNDIHVLEVICDYLSVQLVNAVSALRSTRTTELVQSLGRMRDTLFAHVQDQTDFWSDLADEVCEQLDCRSLPVLYDLERKVYVLDYEGGSSVDLPADVEELFFSETTPAARVGAGFKAAARGEVNALTVMDEPKHARLARVEPISRAGAWLQAHNLPCQGVFVDMGIDGERGELVEDVGPFAAVLPPRRFLLLRDTTQEPIDDLEFDYLLHLARDIELIMEGARLQKSEHRIAQALQHGMRNSLDSVPGLSVDSLYSSATRQALVGGDFYTLIRLPEHQVVMVLGDVSGKGVESASMSSLVKTACTAYAWEGLSPARVARSLNRMLMSFSRVETFVTLFIAKIDVSTGRVTYCSAGHPPSFVLRKGGDGVMESEQLSVQSGVIGAFAGMAYENASLTLDPGDVLFMYTDGAIEARNTAGDFFGEERLRSTLMTQAGQGINGLCASVLDRLDTFSGSSLDDDIALAAIRYDGLLD